MAYYSQEQKAKSAPLIKALFKQYGVKGSISVKDHRKLVVTLKSAPYTMDFKIKLGCSYDQINHPSARGVAEDYSGTTRDFLIKLVSIMDDGNYDNSEPIIDYFDCGWYTQIWVGTYEKPFVYTEIR